MRKSEGVKSADFSAYLAETKGLERDYIGEVLKSRRAWQFAAAGGLTMGVVGLVAVAALTPLKRTETVVLRVDNTTGAVEPVSTLADAQASYGEVVDRYWLNQYVLNRESYDYNTIQANYDATALLSTPEVQREFFKIYEGPDSRDKVLKNTVRIAVNVKSITPNPKTSTAVVRFSTEKRHLDGTADPAENWIATLSYTYVNAPTAEKDRRVNPLGFQVRSYRVDPETVAG